MKKTKKKHRLLAFIAGLLLTGIFTSLLLGTSLVLYAVYGIDAGLDIAALISGQGRTTKLYYTAGTGEVIEMEDQRLHGTENRIWTSLDVIPTDVQNAFIAIEDHRFYEHKGVDFKRTLGAVLSFVMPNSRDYGGSTITQQLIKNLTGDNSVTVKRKLTEIMRALDLEKKVTKDEILECYLNTVYLSEGCYGLETAAETYFGKSASELSLVEGAALAAIIQYPTRYNPIHNPEYNKERRNTVLWRMHELGLLTDDVYKEAIHTELTLHLSETKEETGKNSWFTEVVIEDVIADLAAKYALSRTAASRLLYSGGLSIYTTVDMTLQAVAETFYEDPANFPKSKEGDLAASAAVIINPKNGYLLAVAGNIGEKRSDRILNLATSMPRSPGSVIKPVSVYAPALEKGLITWASVFDDVPITFTEEKGGFTPWPKNNPRVYSGLTTVCDALSKSTNTVAVRVLQNLGVHTSFAYTQSLGLSGLVAEEKTESGKTLSDIALAPLALGATTHGLTLREITNAYNALANGGIYHRSISYTEVYDKDGNRILSNLTDGERVFSEETADIMTRLLENVVTSGTASDLTLKKTIPVAGKTGTSNANTDRWFIGYTPDLLCGVWYGHKDARDIGTHDKNPAVLIFDDLITGVYRGGSAESISLDKSHTFPRSENVVRCLYCKDSGEYPAAACAKDPRGHRIVTGYFKKGTEPKSKCETHCLVKYDREKRAVAMEFCGEENLTEVGLLRLYNRAFPCQIYITDAQFVYRHLPTGVAPTEDQGKAFFQDYYEKDGSYIGISRGESAYNRACAEHLTEETTAEETTTAETTAPETTLTEIITETTAPPEKSTEETTAKEKKHLVPWW